MKIIKVLLLCTVPFFLSCCDEFQVNMSYHFFSESELANISINQDSAMSLQNKVSKLKTYDEFIASKNSYEENDTVYFRDERGDTIKMLSGNRISIQNVPSLFTRTGTKTFLYAALTPVDSTTFEMVSYGLVKESSESFYKEILVTRPNFDYQNIIHYQFLGISNESISGNKCIIKYDYYKWKNTTIDSCMIFIDFDTSKNEMFKIIYSKTHGFLLIKDKQHEIIKI